MGTLYQPLAINICLCLLFGSFLLPVKNDLKCHWRSCIDCSEVKSAVYFSRGHGSILLYPHVGSQLSTTGVTMLPGIHLLHLHACWQSISTQKINKQNILKSNFFTKCHQTFFNSKIPFSISIYLKYFPYDYYKQKPLIGLDTSPLQIKPQCWFWRTLPCGLKEPLVTQIAILTVSRLQSLCLSSQILIPFFSKQIERYQMSMKLYPPTHVFEHMLPSCLSRDYILHIFILET